MFICDGERLARAARNGALARLGVTAVLVRGGGGGNPAADTFLRTGGVPGAGALCSTNAERLRVPPEVLPPKVTQVSGG